MVNPKNTKIVVFLILILTLLFCKTYSPAYGEEVNNIKESTEREIEFENARFHYLNKNYITALFQFKSLLKDYPNFKKKEVINYYLLLQSRLGLEVETDELIKNHAGEITNQTYFSLINNLQKIDRPEKTIPLFERITFAKLDTKEKDTYYYLKAKSYAAMERDIDALSDTQGISISSPFYSHGRILRSELYFKKGETKKAILTLEKLLDEKFKTGSNEPDSIKNKTLLLLGKMLFEESRYVDAIKYLQMIKNDPLYHPEALSATFWTYLNESDYLKAAETLNILKEKYPAFYKRENLQYNHVISYYLSGDKQETSKAISELLTFYDTQKELMFRLIQNDELCNNLIYYMLESYTNIRLIEQLLVSDEELDSFTLVKPNPEFILLSKLFEVVAPMREANLRSVLFFYDYTAFFQKRITLFKNFIQNFKELKPTYTSLKEIILNIEIPIDQIPENNIEHVISRQNEATEEYTKKFNRPLNKLESQLIKILVFEEYSSLKNMDKNVPIFSLALKMMNLLDNLYGDSGDEWINQVNEAVDEHNKSVEMVKKLNEIPRLDQNTKWLESKLLEKIKIYVRKEAFRVIKEINLESEKIENIRKKIEGSNS